jgi:hypothetical protein
VAENQTYALCTSLSLATDLGNIELDLKTSYVHRARFDPR